MSEFDFLNNNEVPNEATATPTSFSAPAEPAAYSAPTTPAASTAYSAPATPTASTSYNAPTGEYGSTASSFGGYGAGQSAAPYTANPVYGSSQPIQPSTPPTPPSGKRTKKKAKSGANMTAGKVVALGLCCAILGGIVGGAGVVVGSGMLSGGSSTSTSTDAATTTTLVESSRTAALESTTYDTTGEVMTASQIYAANVNSCVGITVNITYNVFGYSTTSAASGSGFIITSDGYIVTNYHVVEDGDTDGITVTLYDGTEYEATLIGYDSSNDVAVLKVDATDLTPVVLGDSDSLSVGDDVVAIGNPLGELTFSLTSGVVSALDREVTVSSDSSSSGSITMNLIQTDCAINSGNSGGALFNEYGEVIGITNAKYSSSSSSTSIDNIGFAIPINSVKSIIESIIEKGYVEKPYLGVTLQTYSYTTTSGEVIYGAMIYSVESGSAAETYGLQRGDLIIAIDDTEITSSSDATTAVGNYAAGDTIVVTIDRNGETMEITVVLGAKESSTTTTETESSTSSESSTETMPDSGTSGTMPGSGSSGSGGSGSMPSGGMGGMGGF